MARTNIRGESAGSAARILHSGAHRRQAPALPQGRKPQRQHVDDGGRGVRWGWEIRGRHRDQTLDALPEGGITVKTNFDVAGGNDIVRLVVRDSEGKVMSALNSAVVIP